ncbi:MAG: SEC-C domain-containing protein, partial [Candidatus Competibacteraceae bacterium]|nr:SEC-C domain-containing protein [Candidatus Competibacteraceae bacterium]
MQKLGMEKGEAIEHPWVTKAIENAQRKVEAHNFDIRKNLLEFDDVANDQRKFVYNWRNQLLADDDIGDTIDSLREEVINKTISIHIPPQSLEEQWDVEGLQKALETEYGLVLPIQQWLEEDNSLHEDPLRERIVSAAVEAYRSKESTVGAAVMRQFEKSILLQVLDTHWKEHLAAVDYLRQGIHLRGYAQRNPKQEYKREAFEMFSAMLDRIHQEAISVLARIQFRQEEPPPPPKPAPAPAQMHYEHAEVSALSEEQQAEADGKEAQAAPYVRDERKVGRNEPCPCGSGKKYKHCHGRLS